MIKKQEFTFEDEKIILDIMFKAEKSSQDGNHIEFWQSMMKSEKTHIAIIQARMSSTRLPKKVLRDINGNPMLEYVIKQTLSSKLIKNVIIATTKKMKIYQL